MKLFACGAGWGDFRGRRAGTTMGDRFNTCGWVEGRLVMCRQDGSDDIRRSEGPGISICKGETAGHRSGPRGPRVRCCLENMKRTSATVDGKLTSRSWSDGGKTRKKRGHTVSLAKEGCELSFGTPLIWLGPILRHHSVSRTSIGMQRH